MYYYEVLIRSNHYHGKMALTYASEVILPSGKIVIVPLKNELVTGVIQAQTDRPRMVAKEIASELALPPLPEKSLALLEWLRRYYPSPLGVTMQQFIPAGLKPNSEPVALTAENKPNRKTLAKLTIEQSAAIKKMSVGDTYLLHGRTGSGKTRIYLEMALECFNSGSSVLIMTPEISLTSQLENEFKAVFGNSTVLLHSTLTPKERISRWESLIASRGPLVVIGPRSIVFAPLSKIGLIVVDEEHEPAYKQEQAPYYLTTRVAAEVRRLHGAKLILGSATPLVSDYFLAQNRNKQIIRLDKLAKTSKHKVSAPLIIDFHDRSQFTRSAYISQPLIAASEKALINNQQVLLYLNRRGTARLIICDQCDWQARCPRCDLSLTYHGDTHTLRCHTDGYSTTAPVTCPSCHNPSVKYLSIGTKSIVDEARKIFPDARIVRFDSDNLKSERLEKNYEQLKKGNADIIVGTQLVAKGLDLPNLSVVGVMLADTTLQMPDYNANERTYQLLQQVAGRVGRGHVPGQAIIQTYQPTSTVIKDALEDNWQHFYQDELKERKEYGFPPFTHLLKLTVMRAKPAVAEAAASRLARTLSSDVVVEGPAPCFHEWQNNKSHWQLVIKARNRGSLINIIETLPAGWSYDLDPVSLI